MHRVAVEGVAARRFGIGSSGRRGVVPSGKSRETAVGGQHSRSVSCGAKAHRCQVPEERRELYRGVSQDRRARGESAHFFLNFDFFLARGAFQKQTGRFIAKLIKTANRCFKIKKKRNNCLLRFKQ